jgi:NAD(P)-dependent dehydrogenase (short-subunit alcohol dehydrogenase family)
MTFDLAHKGPQRLAGLVMGLGTTLARRARLYSLGGRNALVTGGARGLGFAIARVLLEKGARVAVVARDAAEVARAVDDLRRGASGDATRVVGEACDLRDGPEIAAMVESVRAKLGPIDVLVNGAGSIDVGPLDAMTFEDFEEAMQLHGFGPLRTILAVRDGMRARGGGRIANIGSIDGIVSSTRSIPQRASKCALVSLSHAMRAELAREGIRVSTIAPGLVRTGRPRRAFFKGDREREYGWFAIADSLPLVPMDADRAARRVVRAVEHGEAHVVLGLPAHVVLGLPARVVGLVEAMAPGLIAEAVNLARALFSQRPQRPLQRP